MKQCLTTFQSSLDEHCFGKLTLARWNLNHLNLLANLEALQLQRSQLSRNVNCMALITYHSGVGATCAYARGALPLDIACGVDLTTDKFHRWY